MEAREESGAGSGSESASLGDGKQWDSGLGSSSERTTASTAAGQQLLGARQARLPDKELRD